LSITDSDDWTFETGDFTIDCWVYSSDINGHRQKDSVL